MLEEARAQVPRDERGWLIGLNSMSATVYAVHGQLASAEKHLEPAVAVHRESAAWRVSTSTKSAWAASVSNARAAISYAGGRYDEAEQHIRNALRAVEKTDVRDGPWADFMRQVLGIYLARAGKLVEGEIESREALLSTLRREGRDSLNTAFVMWGLSTVLIGQGRYEDAERISRMRHAIYERETSEGSSGIGYALKDVAQSLSGQGRWEEAAAVYDRIVGSDGLSRPIVDTPARGIALLRAGRIDDAVTALRYAYEHSVGNLGDGHPDTAISAGTLAMALAGAGDRGAALELYHRAVPILLDRVSRADSEAETRSEKELQIELVFDGYIELLLSERDSSLIRDLGIDAIAEGFRIASVAQSQSVQNAIRANAARAAATDPALGDLARREQDARKQINALYGRLADVHSRRLRDVDPSAAADLQREIEQLRAAHQALIAAIDRDFPDYKRLIDPQPVTIEAARSALRPGEALIVTHLGQRQAFVWAIPYEGEPAFEAAPLDRDTIDHMAMVLRRALEPNTTVLGEIPAFHLPTAYGLYQDQALLEPVRPAWQNAGSLYVIAHRSLGQLPFALLPTAPTRLAPDAPPLFSNYRDVPWLLRSHAITTLPSVGSLAALRRIPAASVDRQAFAGFGDPYFNLGRPGQKGHGKAGRFTGGATQLVDRASHGPQPSSGVG